MPQELTVIENINPVEVFTKEKGSQPIIEEIEKFYRSIDRDISTAKGRDNVRSIAHKIAGDKSKLDKAGEAVKADLKRQVDLIDGERREIRARLDALKEEIRKPLTEFEEKDELRVKAHEDALAFLGNLIMFTAPPASKDVSDRLAELAKYAQYQWEEFSERGKAAYQKALDDLAKEYDAAKKREDDAAELERLRVEAAERKRQEELAAAAEAAKKEAEAKAAKEAQEAADRAAAALKAEQEKAAQEAAAAAKKLKEEQEAKARAEAAAAEAKAAAEAAALKAKQDAEAAEKKRQDDLKAAAEKAEREKAEAIAAEQKRAAEAKAAEERAAAAREADKKHKASIHNETLAALVKYGCKEDGAKALIIAIAKGEIPHVSIKY